ncbi:MAG: ABC transporter permease subunit [Oscillibacter sp.]|jgi:osmoprotectant transport system permease protein|nr:ABC transporter permease subunit [Oscillibacter sp.]
MSWSLVWEHLYIVLLSVLASLALGLPLGILAYLSPKARKPILWIADLFQTIPSLALLGVLMVFFGAGKVTVVCGITLYSLLPIVRNTCLGLTEVDGGLKEAARGCGMSRREQLFRVELPLALPMMFTGIRIAVVNAIGTAVFAAFVGGGGLGNAIYQGIRVKNYALILLPTTALMVIAFVFDTLMGRFERYLAQATRGKNRSRVLPAVTAAAVCVGLIVGTVAFGGGKSVGTLTMYDGNYSETQLLTHMVKELVENRTDLSVTVLNQMSQVNNFNELTASAPSCDLMVSYDGTLLTTFLHQDTTNIPAGITLYDYVNQQAMERYGIRLLGKLGLNNTYAIAVPETVAEEYNLACVSDLIPVADQLTFGAEHEFFTQEGSMKYDPFVKYYGLAFQSFAAVDIGLKYSAIENGSFQVTEVYATDGLNRKAHLKVLEDDQAFFPEYNGAILVRDDMFQKFAGTAPELEDVLGELTGQFTNESMTELTYQVDVAGRSVDEVAHEYLVERGLLK